MERIQRALDRARDEAAAHQSTAEIPAPELRVRAGSAERIRVDAPPPEEAAEPREPAAPDPDSVLPEHVKPARLRVDFKRLRRERVVLAGENSAAGHAYRMLRAQLLQRARARKLRVVGVVSAARGEGKTLTAVNLAISLAAEPNQQVTLVDLDLRRPRIAGLLGVEPASGLETWLHADDSPAGIVHELEGIERLRLVPTLEPLAGSSEALAAPRLRQLLDVLLARDPRASVILDLPPALLTDDVLTVAPLVDAFILVITEGCTLREDVTRVIELLGRERLLGTVLNDSLSSERRVY